MHKKRILFLIIALLIVASVLLAPFFGASVSATQTASYLLTPSTSPPAPVEPGGNRVITANIVALYQVIVYNTLGAINPAGMIYTLRRDVVDKDTGQTEGESAVLILGHAQLREDKRPRPLTHCMNVGRFSHKPTIWPSD